MFRLVRLSLIKQYSATANMVSYTETVEYCRVDNGLVFHTLIADGKEYELENSLTGKNNEINWQYYIKSDDVVLKDLRDTKEYKVVACYGDKDYTLDCVVDRYTLYNGTAYEFTHSTLQIGNLLIGSSEDSFTVSDKKQDFYYILSYTSTKGNVNFDSDANLFEYQEMLDNKKSLKDIFTEFAKNLQIQQVAYRNKCYTNAVIENVVWNDESYYPGGGDNGYYSFDISLTVDGKKITQSYKLFEKEKKYTVSGVLKMEDGTPIPNIYLYVRKEGTEYSVVYTNDKGEYSFQASKGTYCFKAGESFTVDDGPLKKDITLPVCEMYGESSLCLYSDGFASGDITADLKADGSFSFSYVPYGTYTMKLDDKDIGTVTINSADKQQDYTINGYQIAVVVKEANGEFAKDKWIRVEKDEKTEYYYVDNDKGLALVIVDEPGTYEVCSYDNGNRIYYGTVTVTDKNVSCALAAE